MGRLSTTECTYPTYLHTAGQPPELPPKGGGMWPYSWTHVGTPSHLGHMDRVAATMPSKAHAGAAQEAPNIGQWEGQDVPLVRPSSCTVKGGIPSSRRYLPTYLPVLHQVEEAVHHSLLLLQGQLQILPVPVLFRSQLRHVSLRCRLVIQDSRDVLL